MLRPDVYARATEETEKMVEIISGLLKDGLAYNKQGNIFFHVKNDPEYGKLSKYRPRRDAEDRGGARRQAERPAEGGPARLPPLAGRRAGRADLAEPLGTGPTGLAHRVLAR